jgi:hypothetical protein
MAEILQEKWMKGVAMTTTVLAVLTSIASSRSGYCVSKSQVLTAQEGSQWAYYQAKSIKQNLLEAQHKVFEFDVVGAVTSQQSAFLQKTLQASDADIARYDKEKTDIRKEAENTGKANARIARQGNQFSLSVVLFQIGIMLSSVSALLKRREMWIVGLIFGCIATVYLANGVFLFF